MIKSINYKIPPDLPLSKGGTCSPLSRGVRGVLFFGVTPLPSASPLKIRGKKGSYDSVEGQGEIS
ncbi:MAG: hypothetical protein C4581_13040 [Nitrospiraceae bacterium]|nr:MAG: hypothetical protein C4581_13040 [Nitrospiraceae bacterium]